MSSYQQEGHEDKAGPGVKAFQDHPADGARNTFRYRQLSSKEAF